jgi:Ca-activated chloride channel family protein
MLQLAQPEYLWLLTLIPVLLLAFALHWRSKHKALSRFGDVTLMMPLMPGISKRRGWFKIIILCLALFFLSIGLSRPQIGATVREVKSKGVEVIIALDVSNSMLAEDFKPNRLERAKLAISRLVDRLKDDRIGLVVFAGDAYVQLPVTTDYVSAKIFLSSITPDILPRQGTAIGQAIYTAMRCYTAQSEKSRALIIISDGEDHDDDPVTAAQTAAKGGVIVHTIGIGSAEGQPIPTRSGMLKDKNGNIVVTRLDEATLQKIAAAGEGSYTHATNSDLGLDKVVESIRNMEKQELSAIVFEDFNEQFMYLFAFALFFLIIETFVVERKNKWSKNFDIFKKTFLILFFTSLAIPSFAQEDKKDVREGNKLYKKELYNDAEIAYRRGLDKDSLSFVARFNLGDAYYKQEQYEQAENIFKNLSDINDEGMTDAQKAKIMHNLGNAQLQQKKYKESIDSYKKSLRINPTDDETRSNLAYAQLMSNDEQQQQQNQDQNQDQSQDQDKQDQNQNQDNQNQDQNNQEQNQDQDQSNQDQQDKKQQQGQEPKISPQQARQILEAVQADEKQTQEKVNKEKAKALKKQKTDKNW